MVKKRKKAKMKVGQSKTGYRKINGKRRKVRITKLSKGRYRVRVIGKKRRKR